MTYTYTCDQEVLLDIEYEYDVLPGRPATRIDPEEYPEIDMKGVFIVIGKHRIPVPDDIAAQIVEPDDETLISEANEAAYEAACDAADARSEDWAAE